MYAHQRICISTGVYKHICGELDELKKRFFRDNDYRLNDIQRERRHYFDRQQET